MIDARRVTVPRRLDGVDLHVAAGELCALVGPNGAGKTTLLATIAGDVTPSGGTIHLRGRPLSSWPRAEVARWRAVVSQHGAASFPLTVHEVVALGRLPHGDERRADGAVARALDAAGVRRLATRSYGALSGGERQRVNLARALAQVDGAAAPVLLLDEPTAAADLAWQERLLAVLRARADAGACVVVILHDLNLAARWAHRVALLDRGRLLAHGPADVVLDPAVVTATWGIPFRGGRVDGRAVIVPAHAPESS